MAYSNRPNLQLFLERLTSRSVLTEEEQQAVLDLPGRVEQVHANHDFVGLGERVDSACLVIAGLVGRFDQAADGSRQITAIHIAGDVPNLHSVVQPAATSALQALSTATVLHIPHAVLRAATGRHPALAEAFWRDCMVDSAVLSQWVVNVGRRDAKSRVAHLLCEVATRLGARNGTTAFSFPFEVTQSQLADATGLTVVHVNRVLRALREGELAEVHRKEVRTLDWPGLVAVGDFDAGYLQTDIKPGEKLRIMQAS